MVFERVPNLLKNDLIISKTFSAAAPEKIGNHQSQSLHLKINRQNEAELLKAEALRYFRQYVF